MLLFQAYDNHLQQLTAVAERVCQALKAAGIEYRVVGGLAVLFHVKARDPLAARLTKDVDLAIHRADLPRVFEAVRSLGLVYRHVAGVDMLVGSAKPTARSAIHLVFIGEKVRQEYLEPVPGFSPPATTAEGALVASVADLVRMKLTSFRLKDKVHIQDLDGVGLITPEIEAGLPELLRQRLAEVRASD